VRVWRDGEPEQGVAWSSDAEFDLTNWLRFQPPGEFFWSVAVLRGHDGNVDEIIAEATPPARFFVRDTRLPGEKVLRLPDGFSAQLFGQLNEGSMPTVITFGPGGHLYVLTLEGNVYAMIDEDADGAADHIQTVFPGREHGVHHAVGMVFDGDAFYLSDSGRVSRVDDSDGDGMYDTLLPLVENLPSLQYIDHSNNGIAIGPDRRLYIAVGATSDHGPLTEPLEASILRMELDGSNLEVFATGLRNPYDLTFAPNGDLFAVDNSPDQLSKALLYLPPEELNHIRQGYDYGFPRAFGSFTGDTGTEKPVTEFFTSVASSGIAYYAADAFPSEYRDGIFVAQWGTAAEQPLERGLNNGRQVIFVKLFPTDDGTYTGDWETFAEFDQSIGNFRPIDVAVAPDGSLHIAEWNTAAVYRVLYTGVSEEQEAALRLEVPLREDASPEVLAAGEAIYLNGSGGAPACASCHSLDPETRRLGPSLLDLRSRRTALGDGDLEDYVRTSILDPDFYIAPGYRAGYMYQSYAEQLSDAQLDAIVEYVLSIAH
jgi:glucose/arabinose dehydrogenase